MSKPLGGTGGGAATGGGVLFQARAAAWLAVHVLADADAEIPWDLPTAIIKVSCETAAAVDDVLAGTAEGGRIFLQAKRTLQLSNRTRSDLASALDQCVRQFLSSAPTLEAHHDRLVIATGSGSSESIKRGLRSVLSRLHQLPATDDISAAATSESEKSALAVLLAHVRRSWEGAAGALPPDTPLREFLRLLWVDVLEIEKDEPEERRAKDLLRAQLPNPSEADAAWQVLVGHGVSMIASRSIVDRRALETVLLNAGFRVKVMRSYRADVERLVRHSERMIIRLRGDSAISLGSLRVNIDRPYAGQVRAAAEDDSVLVVGAPGAGKSGMLHRTAELLVGEGRDVVVLSAQDPPFSSLGQLRSELQLEHDLTDVLVKWPGSAPAFLLVDALDAARSEPMAQALRTLIHDVTQSAGRWRVIASIREYDIRYGRELRQIFAGSPPAGAVSPLPGNNFKQVRHLVVGALTDAELGQLDSQGSELHKLVSTAPAQLLELLRIIFNLRLAAELLESGTDAGAIRELRTQLDLLELYWSERVLGGGDSREADAREAVLRRAVEGMVRDRSLRLDRDRVADDPAASPALADVLRAHVLVEWAAAPGRAPDRSTLAFAHHILFDYAVERLLLRKNAQRFAAVLAADPTLVLLIRPSVLLHYHHLWDEEGEGSSHGSFWEATLAVCTAPGIPEIGRIVGPSVAAGRARSLSELEPLREALVNPDAAWRQAAEKALEHLVASLLQDKDETFRADAPWSAFVNLISADSSVGTTYPVDAYLDEVKERVGMLTRVQLAELGAAARRLLEFAWGRSPRDRHQVARAIGYVGATFGSAPSESAALFRRALVPEHLAEHGSEEMHWIANQVDSLLAHDPVLVRDIYVAAFSHRETSNAPAPMGGIILPLVSNRRQDYEGALYSLQQSFPAFLKRAPEHAAHAMNQALEAYVAHERSPSEKAEEVAFEFRGGRARVLPDYSMIWDRGHAFPDEYAVQLLDDFGQYVDELVSDPDRGSEVPVLVDLTAQVCRLAAVWRRLLELGTRHPRVLGIEIRELAWTPVILTEWDTSTVAGDFITAIVPHLEWSERAKLERTILLLDETYPSKRRRAGEEARDRLLGCLGELEPVTEKARERLEELRARNAIPENSEPFGRIEDLSSAFGEAGFLERRGVPVDEAPNRAIRDLEEPVKEFVSTFQNAEPAAADVARILPRLQELKAASDRAEENGVHPKQASAAYGTLSAGCESISRSQAMSCTEPAGAFARTILLEASRHPEPRPNPDADAGFDRFQSWGSGTPRIAAAQGLMALARREACADEDLHEAIRALRRDPTPQVRYQIAIRLWSVLKDAPDLGWELLEGMAREEESCGVLIGFVRYSLFSLRGFEPHRVAELAARVYARLSGRGEAKDVRNACAHILLWVYLWKNHDLSRQLTLEIADELRTHMEAAAHLARQLREILTHGPTDPSNPESDTVRMRAIDFLIRVTRSATALAGEGGDQDPAPHGSDSIVQLTDAEFKTLGELFYAAGFDLYIASGAYKRKEGKEPSPAEQARLLAETGPLLDELAGVGIPRLTHHLLETLEVLVPYDPAGVFRRVAKVIRGGRKGNYQYDRMAQDVLVRLVERYLADYRSVFQNDEDLRTALVEVLDTFVAAGSAGARRLTYGLDAIFR